MKKKIVLPAVLALAVLTVGILATSASAQETAYYPPIIEKIAERFSLDVDDVQQVFDEERDGKRAEMYAHFADRLDELVSEGKLTEAQKEAILDKHEQMQDAREEFGSLIPEEKKEKMQNFHEEFRTWLEEQGIDDTLIQGFGKGFLGHGFKKGFGMGLMIGNGR